MENRQGGHLALPRELGLFSATAVVIANMIGTGIFTTTGFIVTEVGSPGAVLLCWLVGGIFALCGALCYGELGVRFPRAGGEYVYLREAFGPCLGFLSGWISLIVGFSAPIAATAMAFASYLLPEDAPRLAPALTACGAIAGLTLLHYHSLRLGARVQNGLTLLKLGVILGLILAAVLGGRGDLGHFRADALDASLFDGRWAVSLIFVSFAYSGWNAAAYLGGEIRAPGRNLPRALVGGTLLVTLLYLALNAAFFYALTPAEMAGHADVGALAAAALFGPGAGRVLGIAIALGLLSALSAMILTGPRVYFAMARDGVFFPAFGRLRPAQRTPAASIALQAALAGAMVLSATFDTLLIYIGFTLSLSALLAVVGLMVLRRRQPLTASYRTPGYPLTPVVFIVGNVWILAFTLTSRPVTALYGLGTIALGLLAYRSFRRRAGRCSCRARSQTDGLSLVGKSLPKP